MRGFAETGKPQQQRKEPVELLGGGQTASSAGPTRNRGSGNRLFQNALGNAPARSSPPVSRRNVDDAPIELLAPEPKAASSAPAPVASASRPVTQEQSASTASFGIKGAGNPQMKVLIEGLVQGTTAVDVEVCFLAICTRIALKSPYSSLSNNTSTSSQRRWLLPQAQQASLQSLQWRTERSPSKWCKSSTASSQMATP